MYALYFAIFCLKVSLKLELGQKQICTFDFTTSPRNVHVFPFFLYIATIWAFSYGVLKLCGTYIPYLT